MGIPYLSFLLHHSEVAAGGSAQGRGMDRYQLILLVFACACAYYALLCA